MDMRGWMLGTAKRTGWIARSRTVVGALVFLFAVNGLVFRASAGKDDRVVAEFVGKSWVNGRSWDHLDYSGRLGFVCGLYDGITLFYSTADARKTTGKGSLAAVYNALAAPSSLTVGDVVKGMDEFYQDTANVPLPAICAYLHFVYKSRGDSRESINERVAVWRKMFRDK
jgi:hypothetical protein